MPKSSLKITVLPLNNYAKIMLIRGEIKSSMTDKKNPNLHIFHEDLPWKLHTMNVNNDLYLKINLSSQKLTGEFTPFPLTNCIQIFI